MTKKKSKRLLSFLLSLVMVFTLTISPAFTGNTTVSADETNAVAKIDETGVTYSSLEAAIEAVVSDQTITLLQDVDLTKTLTIYKSITLALGEHTITSTADDKALYTTQTLKITATTGGITSSTGNAIVNQKGSGTGTLTINGGTYTSSASHAIYNNNGTVIVNSGTITSTSETARDGICCYSNATVTVNGGTISGTRYGIYSLYSLEVKDGTISGTKAGVYLNDGTATISGGTIKGTEGLKGTSSVSSIVISDGTFEGTTHGVYVCNNNIASLTANNSGDTALLRYVKLVSPAAAITVDDTTTEYGTIAAAIEAAGMTETTITLLASTSEDVVIPEGARWLYAC